MTAELATSVYTGIRAYCEVYRSANQYYLLVHCPGVAWYSTGLKMTAEEIECFTRNPQTADDLALSICKDNNAYADRLLTQDEWDGLVRVSKENAP